jgi:hypothetical protein
VNELKVDLSLVAVPLPADREAAYREGMRILAKLVRKRAEKLLQEYSKEVADGQFGRFFE